MERAIPAPGTSPPRVDGLQPIRRTFDGVGGPGCEIDLATRSSARHRDESGVRVIKSSKLMGFLSRWSQRLQPGLGRHRHPERGRQPSLEPCATMSSLCRWPADPSARFSARGSSHQLSLHPLCRGSRDSRWSSALGRTARKSPLPVARKEHDPMAKDLLVINVDLRETRVASSRMESLPSSTSRRASTRYTRQHRSRESHPRATRNAGRLHRHRPGPGCVPPCRRPDPPGRLRSLPVGGQTPGRRAVGWR